MNNFIVGQYVIYINGEILELGRIARLCPDGAFVCYHNGETAAKTSYDLIFPIKNEYCIVETTLGGERFNE